MWGLIMKVNMEIIYEIEKNWYEENRNKISKYDKLQEENVELKKLKEYLVLKHIAAESNISEKERQIKKLENEIKSNKKKAKDKYKKMKLELMNEVIYLKSRIVDKDNIYEVIKRKPQNIVQIS